MAVNVADTAAEPGVAGLGVTRDGRVGAYVGVPLRLSDGSLYGALCGIGHGAREDLSERHVELLRFLGELVVEALEHTEGEERERRSELELSGVHALIRRARGSGPLHLRALQDGGRACRGATTAAAEGLKGEQIPIASRITLACDAYHAMTSDRPHRAALSPAEARAELADNSGSQFDPAVVAALLDTLNS